jgi:hypothetical protein
MLSDRIRDQLRDEVGPCPCCKRPKATISEIAGKLGQPASSLGRYLAGGKPSVAMLDTAEAHLARDAEPPEDGLGAS